MTQITFIDFDFFQQILQHKWQLIAGNWRRGKVVCYATFVTWCNKSKKCNASHVMQHYVTNIDFWFHTRHDLQPWSKSSVCDILPSIHPISISGLSYYTTSPDVDGFTLKLLTATCFSHRDWGGPSVSVWVVEGRDKTFVFHDLGTRLGFTEDIEFFGLKASSSLLVMSRERREKRCLVIVAQ